MNITVNISNVTITLEGVSDLDELVQKIPARVSLKSNEESKASTLTDTTLLDLFKRENNEFTTVTPNQNLETPKVYYTHSRLVEKSQRFFEFLKGLLTTTPEAEDAVALKDAIAAILKWEGCWHTNKKAIDQYIRELVSKGILAKKHIADDKGNRVILYFPGPIPKVTRGNRKNVKDKKAITRAKNVDKNFKGSISIEDIPTPFHKVLNDDGDKTLAFAICEFIENAQIGSRSFNDLLYYLIKYGKFSPKKIGKAFSLPIQQVRALAYDQSMHRTAWAMKVEEFPFLKRVDAPRTKSENMSVNRVDDDKALTILNNSFDNLSCKTPLKDFIKNLKKHMPLTQIYDLTGISNPTLMRILKDNTASDSVLVKIHTLHKNAKYLHLY